MDRRTALWVVKTMAMVTRDQANVKMMHKSKTLFKRPKISRNMV
jgi:hypothetical protein